MVNTKLLLLILTPAITPLLLPRTRGQKRQREEVDEASALSEHDSREFDDVTAACEDPHHQIGIQSKRKREREDKVLWSYALDKPPKGQPERGNSNQELFYCKRCQKQCSSLTFARAHLKNKHGINIPLKTSKVDEATKSTIGALFDKQKETTASKTDSKVDKILRDSVNETDFINALCYLIVTRNLPHTIVEWPEFRAFLHICNHTIDNLLYKSANSVPLLIGKTFVIHKDLVKKRLQKAISKVHFTTDCWTAPNKSAFQAVTAHFVDEVGHLSKATLALREHKESHGGEEQAEVLIKVLDEFDIKESQIGYITGTLY